MVVLFYTVIAGLRALITVITDTGEINLLVRILKGVSCYHSIDLFTQDRKLHFYNP